MEFFCSDPHIHALLEIYPDVERVRKIRQIAHYISNLPSEVVLKEFCKTEDLRFFWWVLRKFYQYLAECFLILFLRDNIKGCKLSSKEVFKEALKQKQMCRKDGTIYELEAERLLKEWYLVECGFPHLQTDIENFQFYDDVQLFRSISVSEARIVQDIKLRSSSYYEVLIPERGRLFNQVYEAAEGIIEKRNKALKIVLKNPSVYKDQLKEEIMAFLNQKSLGDQSIKQKIKDLQRVNNDLALTLQDSCNTRTSSGKHIKSEVWKYGKRYFLRQELEEATYWEELKLYRTYALTEIKRCELSH